MLILNEAERNPIMSAEIPDLPKMSASQPIELPEATPKDVGQTSPGHKTSPKLSSFVSPTNPASPSHHRTQSRRRHRQQHDLKQSSSPQQNPYHDLQQQHQQQQHQQQQQQQQRQPNYNWDINDSTIPIPDVSGPFDVWPTGHCRRVYRSDCDDARRHVSGWAMRNTNNHNALILKKSCLGVLVCSLDCVLDNGKKVHLRPAICDKARRKQMGKPCPNPNCCGKLDLLPCRGHCGYPVTHFWRHINNFVFFQAKGYHDHARPDIKSLSEKGRNALAKHFRHSLNPLVLLPSKRRSTASAENSRIKKMATAAKGNEVMCSCSPFECSCNKSLQLPKREMMPALEYYKPPQHVIDANTCGPLGHGQIPRPSPFPHEQLTPGPFTQINITNTCLQPPVGEAINPMMEAHKTVVNVPIQNPYVCYPGSHALGKDDHARFVKLGGGVDEPPMPSSTIVTPHNPVPYPYEEDRLRHQEHSSPPVPLRSSDLRMMNHSHYYWTNNEMFPPQVPDVSHNVRQPSHRFEESVAYDNCRTSPGNIYPPNALIPMKPEETPRTPEINKHETTQPAYGNPPLFVQPEVQPTTSDTRPEDMALTTQNFLFDMNAMAYNNDASATEDAARQMAVGGHLEPRQEYEVSQKHNEVEGKGDQQPLTYTILTAPNKCGFELNPVTCQSLDPATAAPVMPAYSMGYQIESTNLSSYTEETGIPSAAPQNMMMGRPMERDVGTTPMTTEPQSGLQTVPRMMTSSYDPASSSATAALRNGATPLNTLPSYHDAIMPPNGDQHIISGYSQTASYHNSSSSSYGYYYGDSFQGPTTSQSQRQSKGSINITLTYN